MRCMSRKNRGFTLVEMLVVTVILAVISMTLYTTFSKGIMIWQRINRQIPEEDLNIFFDRFTTDLTNSFNFKPIGFLGREYSLEFATLVDSPRLQNRTVGKVAYTYDPQGGVVNRIQMDYSSAYNQENIARQQLLRNVRSLKFQYYIYDNQMKEYVWVREYTEGKVPVAARVELEAKYDDQIKWFTRTVSVPSSG